VKWKVKTLQGMSTWNLGDIQEWPLEEKPEQYHLKCALGVALWQLRDFLADLFHEGVQEVSIFCRSPEIETQHVSHKLTVGVTVFWKPQ